MTTDREDLYQQALKTYRRDTVGQDHAVRAVVDFVLDSQPAPTGDGESLADLVRGVRDGRDHTVQIDGVLIAPCDDHGLVASSHAQKPQPWDVLREAREIARAKGVWINDTAVSALAARLEADHRAAQDRATADAAREKLIEKAAQTMCDSHNGPGAFSDREPGDATREAWRFNARLLADAGMLVDPDAEVSA